MTDQDPAPKLHVDSDWKAEAQAEKSRLAEQEAKSEAAKAEAGDQPGAPGQLPEANFKTLVGVLASQAIGGLGTYKDPETGGLVIDLPGSKFAIDLLAVVETKTEGNRTDEESSELTQLLAELRSRFVQVAEAIAHQQAEMAAGGVPGGGGPTLGNPAGHASSGIIETP